MFFYEGYTCPVCGEKFKETDDIVACPECGAPHHRDCWKAEGHCFYADKHGTDEQWKRPADEVAGQATAQGSSDSAASNKKVCPNCGEHNPEYAEFCAHCGRELPSNDWSSAPPSYHNPPPQNSYTPPYQSPFQPPVGGYGEYMPFHMPTVDPCGGIPKEEDIDGVTAEDLANITGNNSAYYVPRFHKMANGGSKCSWNWPAFLLTPYWLLYRKNYVLGAVLLCLSVARSLITSYLTSLYIVPLITDATTMIDAYRILLGITGNEGLNLTMWIFALMGLAQLLIHLFFGLSGNYWYMRTCVSRVKRLRAKKPDLYPQELTAAGGTSFLIGASAYAILYFATMLISTLFL